MAVPARSVNDAVRAVEVDRHGQRRRWVHLVRDW